MANKNASLGDRFAEVTVIAVTVIALLAGWTFKSSVENRSVPFQADGVSVSLPASWLKSEGADGNLVSVTDLTSNGFLSSYSLKSAELPADVTYKLFASAETRNLSEKLLGFRVLSQQTVHINGIEAFEIKYVFVESNPNVARQELPAVVLGVEYIFIKDGHAVAATYWADESEYEAGLAQFQRFVTSIKF